MNSIMRLTQYVSAAHSYSFFLNVFSLFICWFQYDKYIVEWNTAYHYMQIIQSNNPLNGMAWHQLYVKQLIPDFANNIWDSCISLSFSEFV